MVELSKCPEMSGLTPKQMRRAWTKFCADNNEMWPKWVPVSLAINTLILNEGHESELWARQYLDQRLAEFRRG